MKKALDYKITEYHKKFRALKRNRIIEALRYIKSRGVVVVWTRENSSSFGFENYSTYEIPQSIIPEIPHTLTLTTRGTLEHTIEYINWCLNYIQRYDDFQDKNPDNEEILEIKRKAESEVTEEPENVKLDSVSFGTNDIINFAADLLYYKVNPNTKMDIPNAAYIQAEKAVKRYLETGTTRIKDKNDDIHNTKQEEKLNDMIREWDEQIFLSIPIDNLSDYINKLLESGIISYNK